MGFLQNSVFTFVPPFVLTPGSKTKVGVFYYHNSPAIQKKGRAGKDHFRVVTAGRLSPFAVLLMAVSCRAPTALT